MQIQDWLELSFILTLVPAVLDDLRDQWVLRRRWILPGFFALVLAQLRVHRLLSHSASSGLRLAPAWTSSEWLFILLLLVLLALPNSQLGAADRALLLLFAFAYGIESALYIFSLGLLFAVIWILLRHLKRPHPERIALLPALYIALLIQSVGRLFEIPFLPL
ncbi:MAG: hypothetical protein Q4P72_00790 [Eubacteriales bacterium]|nr:hypothetical protein [Eubacteriales bacterium]